MKTFEQFLREKHAEDYVGTDDGMIEDFENWIQELPGSEVFNYAEEWHRQELENMRHWVMKGQTNE